jgi:hypothetical protein
MDRNVDSFGTVHERLDALLEGIDHGTLAAASRLFHEL